MMEAVNSSETCRKICGRRQREGTERNENILRGILEKYESWSGLIWHRRDNYFGF
jgi:hypothetical protein